MKCAICSPRTPWRRYEGSYSSARVGKGLLPDTPDAQWDAEWAHDLSKDALARLAKRYAEFSSADKEVLELSTQVVWAERMHAAGLANDPTAFRAALEGWVRVGLEAMEFGRVEGGAA